MLQVEYIESTGTQYIDTGFKHNQDTRFIADFEFSNVQNWTYPIGSFGGANGAGKLFTIQINSGKILGTIYGNSNHNTSISANGRHTFDLNKNTHKIDNSSYSYTAQTFQSVYNDLIFAVTDYAGVVNQKPTSIKLYSAKIYDNGTLVRDFIPVLDDNGVACLYDQVGSQLYYNQGTGLFAHPQPTDMTLIFDRTNNDVKLGRLKGQYNAFDLNRVEHWCRYLADELNAVGYNIQITTKETWTQTDMRTSAEMERIRKNIQKIMEGYHWITKIYANAESFNYVKANNWEKILYEIYSLMYGMQNMYVYGGVARGGEPLLWQNNFMHLYNG